MIPQDAHHKRDSVPSDLVFGADDKWEIQDDLDGLWSALTPSERAAWLARKARESFTWPVREVPITPDEDDDDAR